MRASLFLLYNKCVSGIVYFVHYMYFENEVDLCKICGIIEQLP